MSEDTAHGQHFEPAPVTPINGAATWPQVQQAGEQATLEQLLKEQSGRVQELGIRVHSLLLSAIETYDQFITESWGFFKLISMKEEANSANRPVNENERGGQQATSTQVS